MSTAHFHEIWPSRSQCVCLYVCVCRRVFVMERRILSAGDAAQKQTDVTDIKPPLRFTE